MEKKSVSVKWIGMIAAALAVVVAVVLLVLHFTKKEDSYRSIQIYELDGAATIEREGIGTIDAVENLYLESGDRITVPAGSFMRLKLDDDKYIMVEEDTILSIVAEGNEKDSRTSILLEQGAIVNEIQSKLNDKSSYEVTTPNAVMAVRGTVFRVETVIDGNGEADTKVSTFEGKVGASLILPDGTITEDSILVEAGKEVAVHSDDEGTEFTSEPQDIDYRALPSQTMEYLTDILGHDVEETVTNPTSGQTDSPEDGVTEETSEPDETVPAEENGEEEQAEQKVETETEETAEETETEETAEETVEEETTTEETEEQVQTVVTYKVTFLYNGTVFGTQTVEEGKTVSVPKLSPAGSGAWNFDFSTAITGDTTINWE